MSYLNSRAFLRDTFTANIVSPYNLAVRESLRVPEEFISFMEMSYHSLDVFVQGYIKHALQVQKESVLVEKDFMNWDFIRKKITSDAFMLLYECEYSDLLRHASYASTIALRPDMGLILHWRLEKNI